MRAQRFLAHGLGHALLAVLVTVATFAVAPATAAAQIVEPRIFNPDPVAAKVPWQAALLPSDNDELPLAVFCGATVRDESHVITSAQCVEGDDAREIDVAAGFVSRGAPGEGLQRIPVSTISTPPAFDANVTGNDLAVLRLERPFRFTGAVDGPAPLPLVGPGSDDTGSRAQISGWGLDVPDLWWPEDGPDLLATAPVRVLADSACAGYGFFFRAATMLCAGGSEATVRVDACQGDAGGPLARGAASPGDLAGWRLIGIVSWGSDCDPSGDPGVYTRLANPDLNARATDPNPPARLEPLRPPHVVGHLQAGQTLTCDGSTWTSAPDASAYTWMTWRLGPDDTWIDSSYAGLSKTLVLTDADAGRMVTCEERAANAGGARIQFAQVRGPVAARPPAPPEQPAPPAPPVTQPPVALPRDVVRPTSRYTRRHCARRRCSLTIVARDAGGPATKATVRYRRVSGCPRGRRGRRCRAVRTLRARSLGQGVFELRSPRLAPARWRFTVVAVDAAGNRGAPVSVVLSIGRR